MRAFAPSLRVLGSVVCLPGTVALLAALWSPPAASQDPPAGGGTSTQAPAESLDKLVGRIALYPDDLVAIILPASTNPLQIVQADRFLTRRKTDPNLKVDEKWDDAVKSLLNYPEVVASMSGDLDWTAALGEAVVDDQGKVLDAIQAFRRKAQSAGNLKSDSKQVVVVEKEIVKIEPADPQVIYVPQYDASTVVVHSAAPAWGYYPTPYPVYYYPYAPGAAFATGLIWGAAIGAAWNGNHYAAHYGGNANINVNRNVNNINRDVTNIDSARGNVNRSATGGGTTSRWTPDKQRGQVSSSVGASRPARVGDAAGTSAATRTSTSAGAAERASSRSGSSGARASGGQSGGQSANAGAFDGYGSGRQAQMDSSRGAASRSAASASTRPAASQSAAPRGGRSPGGGGGGGGGGGRGRR